MLVRKDPDEVISDWLDYLLEQTWQVCLLPFYCLFCVLLDMPKLGLSAWNLLRQSKAVVCKCQTGLRHAMSTVADL